MFIWTSGFAFFLACGVVYAKPQNHNKSQLEALTRELNDLNEEELRVVLEGWKLFGKSQLFVNTYLLVIIIFLYVEIVYR